MWRNTVGLMVTLVMTLTAAGAEGQVPRRGVPPAAAPPPGVTLTVLDDATPPTNVAASATITSVTLTWPPVAEATGYTVARAPSAGGPYGSVTPAPIPASDTGLRQPRQLAGRRFTDTGVSANTTYYYTVTALRADGHWGVSAPVSVKTQPAVNPTNFKAMASGKDVTLSWDAMPEASYYWLTSGPGIVSQKLSATSLTVPNVPPGTHTYGLLAYYAGGASADEANPSRATVTVGAPVAAGPAQIWGFADLHTHQHANLAFGGLLVWGQSYGAADHALAWDTPAHGPGGTWDVIGWHVRKRNHHPSVGTGPGHLVGGYPQFDGWPTYDGYTHQQYYQEWLKRALDGGLKLMVMYAVNAEALCAVSKKAPGRTCDDMEAVDLQINAAKAMEQHIDNQYGGAGRGWYRIVRTPQDAREAIAKGQLAVVLGIEVQSLFNCQYGRSGCDLAHVKRELNRYHAMGVRQLIPIHNTNNRFGGTAIFRDQYNANNYLLSGTWLQAGACGGGVQFHLGAPSVVERSLIALHQAGLPDAAPSYPTGATCNTQGLTQLGRELLQMMMHRKMLIDIDHLSQKSFADAYTMAKQWTYPLVSSHTGLVMVSLGPKKTEFWKTEQQVAQIRELGGLIGVLLHQGRRDEVQQFTQIPHDCGNSTKTWAQVYLQTVTLSGGAPVALSSDFGGLVPGLAPRFGKNACDGDGNVSGQSNPVVYPFNGHGIATSFVKSIIGQRIFDYNEDGLAHIGLLPDFVQDLKNVGLTSQQLEPLFRSAEAYIGAWERMHATSVPEVPVPPELVLTVTPGPPSGPRASVTVTANDKASGAAKTGTVQIGLQKTPATGPTGQAVYYVPCFQVDSADKEFRDAVPCPGTVTVAGYPSAKFDAPNPTE